MEDNHQGVTHITRHSDELENVTDPDATPVYYTLEEWLRRPICISKTQGEEVVRKYIPRNR